VPDYIEADHGKKSAKFIRIPTLTDVPYPVKMEPQLVVEFYSRWVFRAETQIKKAAHRAAFFVPATPSDTHSVKVTRG